MLLPESIPDDPLRSLGVGVGEHVLVDERRSGVRLIVTEDAYSMGLKGLLPTVCYRYRFLFVNQPEIQAILGFRLIERHEWTPRKRDEYVAMLREDFIDRFAGLFPQPEIANPFPVEMTYA